MRALPIAATILCILTRQGVAQTVGSPDQSSPAEQSSTPEQSTPLAQSTPPLQGTVEYESPRQQVITQMDVTQAAGSVRKDATDGIGAPQVGLDPRYPSSAQHWDDVKARYPGAAGAYEPCVDDYLQATQAIKQVAPLTRRPTWDVSGKQINGAIQQAADLVSAGDK
jgi:hypothetical protein